LACWQLDQIWPKGQRHPAQFSGQILRWLGAQLQISAVADQLKLRNLVTLGPVELRFEGPGELRGRRPLLVFHFDQLQIWIAGRCWFSRQLPEPRPQKTSVLCPDCARSLRLAGGPGTGRRLGLLALAGL